MTEEFGNLPKCLVGFLHVNAVESDPPVGEAPVLVTQPFQQVHHLLGHPRPRHGLLEKFARATVATLYVLVYLITVSHRELEGNRAVASLIDSVRENLLPDALNIARTVTVFSNS